jgi:hypothetical protein
MENMSEKKKNKNSLEEYVPNRYFGVLTKNGLRIWQTVFNLLKNQKLFDCTLLK